MAAQLLDVGLARWPSARAGGVERRQVGGAGEDTCACAGPAVRQPCVVDVRVREQHRSHVGGREAVRLRLRHRGLPRAIEVRPGVDEQYAALGQIERVDDVVAEGDRARVGGHAAEANRGPVWPLRELLDQLRPLVEQRQHLVRGCGR